MEEKYLLRQTNKTWLFFIQASVDFFELVLVHPVIHKHLPLRRPGRDYLGISSEGTRLLKTIH